MRLIFDDFLDDAWAPIVYEPSNHVVTREYGSMPFVRPAPHDQTLLEQANVCEEDTSDVFCKVIHLYQDGYYNHRGSWAAASNELGLLGRLGPSAEAIRRDIRLREAPRKTLVIDI